MLDLLMTVAVMLDAILVSIRIYALKPGIAK